MKEMYAITDMRIADKRNTGDVTMWAIARDRFMSNWGRASGRSLVAYPCDDVDSQVFTALLDFMGQRSDYIRVRTAQNLPRLRQGDNLCIYDVPERVKR